jgi:hypothetical protein
VDKGPGNEEVDAAIERAMRELQHSDPPTPAEIAEVPDHFGGNVTGALSVVEIIALLRHLRWGYARYGLMWLIVSAGLVFLERYAAIGGDTLVWLCSLAAWGACLWACGAFWMALFASDKRLLESFEQQMR